MATDAEYSRSMLRERGTFNGEPKEVPDWPAELVESVERLGQPTDVFRVPRTHAARKIIYGLTLMIGGCIANYLYWVVFNGQVVAEHFLFLVLFGPLISGIALISAAWRDRGLWILIYPMGLLRWQRGEVVTFPWTEIQNIVFHRVTSCDRPQRTLAPDGTAIGVWLPIAKEGSKALGAHLNIRRNDEVEAILPSGVDRFSRLCQIVQEETFRGMYPEAWKQFLQAKRVKFGDLALSTSGIHRGSDFLPWYEFEDMKIANGRMQIRSRLMHRSWLEIPLQNVDNPHVFVALLFQGPEALDELQRQEAESLAAIDSTEMDD